MRTFATLLLFSISTFVFAQGQALQESISRKMGYLEYDGYTRTGGYKGSAKGEATFKLTAGESYVMIGAIENCEGCNIQLKLSGAGMDGRSGYIQTRKIGELKNTDAEVYMGSTELINDSKGGELTISYYIHCDNCGDHAVQLQLMGLDPNAETYDEEDDYNFGW